MCVKGLLLFNHIYPDFLWVWHIGWIIWLTLTWPKKCDKPYRDYPQWIKPPCLLKPPETQIPIFKSFYDVVIFKGWCPSLTNLQGFMSKQCTVFLHCPYYMFDGCSYPKLWDGQKKMKLSKRNLNCCRHFDCYLHIDSRSSSNVDIRSPFPYDVYGGLHLIYYHRFHFIALPTFTINFISWTAAAFITSFI